MDFFRIWRMYIYLIRYGVILLAPYLFFCTKGLVLILISFLNQLSHIGLIRNLPMFNKSKTHIFVPFHPCDTSVSPL